MRNVTAASVQFEHKAGEKATNLAKIRGFVEQAARRNAEIIVFPECCITGYLFLKQLSRDQLTELAEPVFDGPSSQALMALAKEHKMSIGAGLVEIDDDGTMYNTYVVAMPDGRFERHRKIHCFISEYMSCGSEVTVFDMPNGCRAGVLTCYDNNLGENVRIAALKGAEILLAPHQSGGCKTPSPYCMGVVERSVWEKRKAEPAAIEAEFKGPKGRQWFMTWLPARAHDNGMFLVFSNGVGVDGDEIRTGNATILDPYGRVITETCKADDCMVVAELDASLRENCTGVRWIKTRRPELYAMLIVPTGLEEDIRRSRFPDESGAGRG